MSKFVSIQYLRAVAASVVVLQHASSSMPDTPIEAEFGAWGVDLFFVISGFIMFHTTAGGRGRPADFAVRRVVRIVPLYLILTTVAFAIAVLAPSLTRTFSPAVADYVRSLLFVPFVNERTGTVQPVLGQGWTLNYEMFFYLLFTLALFLPARMRLAGCWTVLGSLAAAGILFEPRGLVPRFYTDPIVIEFAFGMLVAYVAGTSLGRLPRLAAAFALLGITCVLAGWITGADASRAFRAGLLAAATVALAVWAESTSWKPASAFGELLGDASYSMYLSHTFVLAVAWRLAYAITGGWDGIAATLLFMAACLAACMVVAVLLYRWVERPVGRMLHARLPRGRAARAAVVPAAARAPGGT
jgi:exopolysaccharide production protein ExoZ